MVWFFRVEDFRSSIVHWSGFDWNQNDYLHILRLIRTFGKCAFLLVSMAYLASKKFFFFELVIHFFWSSRFC
jgi:hypothetical protein